jgi:hypothetical protein
MGVLAIRPEGGRYTQAGEPAQLPPGTLRVRPRSLSRALAQEIRAES